MDAYVAGLSGALAEVAERLRHLVMGAAPSASESIKWGQPVYEDNGPFCYFKSSASHITFGFWRGNELEDPAQVLESEGERMKYVALRSLDDVDEDLIGRWVRQAVDLNWRLGSPTRLAEGGAPQQVIEPEESGESEAEAPAPARSEWSPSSEQVEVDVDLDDDDRDGARYSGEAGGRDSGQVESSTPGDSVPDVLDDDSFEPNWKDGER